MDEFKALHVNDIAYNQSVLYPSLSSSLILVLIKNVCHLRIL